MKFATTPDGYLAKTPIVQFILLSCLFPLWGAAASLNDILITQFKSVFTLSDFASALVQSAFYGGYFCISIPASMIIAKTTYKTGILIGLVFYIGGCSLFFPASTMATYNMFLCAVFSIAIGLGFLETAANTYSAMIGPKKTSTLRLNISQTFTPIGFAGGILLGKYLIFQDADKLEVQMQGLNAEQLHAFKLDVLQHTLHPYKMMIYVLVIVFVLFLLTKYPKCKISSNEPKSSFLSSIKYLASNASFKSGILAQFLYVGLQVAIWSFTIRLALSLDHSLNERAASNYMLYSFICFFIGKFICNILLTKFSARKILMSYSLIGIILILYTAFSPDFSAVYSAIAISALMGPCWPTIYTQTLKSVEQKYTITAGAVLVMSIIGAAVVPAIQGLISDLCGSLQKSFLINVVCFAYVGYYFLRSKDA